MGILQRIIKITRTWANRGLSWFETPEVIIEAALHDAREQRRDTHAALHATLTAVVETRQVAREKRTRSDGLRDQAVALRDEGHQAHAVAVMQAALLETRTADELDEICTEMDSQNGQLTVALTELDSILAVADAHAQVELARLQQARGSRAAVEARYGPPDGAPGPFKQLEVARAKIRHIQASAAASYELGQLNHGPLPGPVVAIAASTATVELDAAAARRAALAAGDPPEVTAPTSTAPRLPDLPPPIPG